jgi:hypothetical protein
VRERWKIQKAPGLKVEAGRSMSASLIHPNTQLLCGTGDNEMNEAELISLESFQKGRQNCQKE